MHSFLLKYILAPLDNSLFPTDPEEAYWGQLILSNLYELNVYFDSYYLNPSAITVAFGYDSSADLLSIFVFPTCRQKCQNYIDGIPFFTVGCISWKSPTEKKELLRRR